MADTVSDPCNYGTDASKSSSCKVRLARVFKAPTQSSLEIMAELKALSDKDIADFRDWFNAAGYPTT